MAATVEEILDVYRETGSKRKTSKILGIPRSTVRAKIEKHIGKEKTSVVKIKGIMPTIPFNPETVIDDLIKAQSDKEEKINLSRNQKVIINDNQPFVISLFADLHLGNNKSNYKAIKRDTELTRDCPFCYSILAGDFSENWIGKLGHIAREQSMSGDSEQALVKWWFDQLTPSIIACCAGNHDNRSIIYAGIDYIRGLLGDAVMLYDQDQILFTLEAAESENRFKVRHRDQYKSILNPFHGAFRDIERGDSEWDIYISGHDHKATLFGECIHHDKKRKVCRIGTYKMDDRYGKFLGFARSYGTGSGALVIMPDGTVESFSDIELAIRYCTSMR